MSINSTSQVKMVAKFRKFMQIGMALCVPSIEGRRIVTSTTISSIDKKDTVGWRSGCRRGCIWQEGGWWWWSMCGGKRRFVMLSRVRVVRGRWSRYRELGTLVILQVSRAAKFKNIHRR